MTEPFLPQNQILSLRNVFGLNSKVKNNIWYINETTVVYPSGRCLVFHQSNGVRKIRTGSENTEGISALCLSPNRKYLAVAEKTEGLSATVKISDVKKNPPSIKLYETAQYTVKKTISHPITGSHEFVCIAFSLDGKYLVAQGGGPEYNLVLWSMEGKTRVVDTICTSSIDGDPVFQCSISPDNKTICVTGNGVFKLLAVDDKEKLKVLVDGLGKRDHEPYLSHTWLSEDRLIISNANGDLFLMENMEFKLLLPSSPSDGLSITSLIPYGSGFVCGGENGILSIFEKSGDDKEVYARSKTLRITNSTQYKELSETYLDHKILNFNLSPSNENLVLSTSSSQIFTLNISSSDILQKEDDIKFEYLSIPFHSKPITGMSTAIRKPIVATCSTDKTVRVWNYMDNSLNIVRHYPTEAYSVALHPSGLHLVVGFQDKLRFMDILGDDIREQKSFLVRNCAELKFSNGGHFFAAAHGNVINIYNTYTLQLISALRGHNGKIKALQWSDDDTRVISVGMDGAVYEYVIKTEKRTIHHTNKSVAYTSVITDGKNIYVCGSDCKIKSFSEGNPQAEYDTGDNLLVSMEYSEGQKMIFGGLDNGIVTVHSFPNLEFIEDKLLLHSGPINRIVKSWDDSYIFTAGEDGMLGIVEIRDRDGGKTKKDTKYSEEILISGADWEEKNNTIGELQAKVQELKSDHEYEQKKKEIEFNNTLREQAKNFNNELTKKQEELQSILQDKKTVMEDYEKKIDDLIEKHREKIKALEQDFNERLANSLEQISELNKEKDKEKKSIMEEAKFKEESHMREITDMTEEYEDEIKKRDASLSGIQDEKNELEKKFTEIKSQMEEDQDKEIKILKEMYEKKILKMNDSYNEAKSEANKWNDRFIALQKTLKQKLELIEKLEEKKQRAENFNKQYQEDIQKMTEENKEREETIIDKEKRIFKLKRQNQELEKFRFVLEYKISTLQEQIKPSKEEITTLRKESKKMRKELEKSKEKNDKLVLTIKDLELKIDGRVKEIQRLNFKIKDSDTLLKRIRGDIYKVAQLIQEPKELKEEVTKLYQNYVSEKINTQEMDFDILKEYDRQRAYLEKTVDSLQKKLIKAAETSKSDNKRIMNENVVLIKEINELRKEVRTLKSKLKEKEVESKIGKKNSAENLASALDRSSDLGGITSLEQALKEIDMQRTKIQALREKIEEMEAEKRALSRPISRERLPPVIV